MNVHTLEKNLPIRAKENWNRNLMRLSEQALELVSFSMKQAEIYIYYVLNKAS